VTTLPTELAVFSGSRRVGTIIRANSYLIQFSYDPSYQQADNATRLSFSLPLTSQIHTPRISTNYFSGLLTDNPNVNSANASLWRVDSADTFAMLAMAGADTPGAIQILPGGSRPLDQGSITWIDEHELGDRVNDQLRIAGHGSRPRYDEGRWSLPGAQAKLAVRREGNKWGIPAGIEPTTHILKPAAPGYENFDIHETALMQAAGALGMQVADTYLHSLPKELHVLVSVRYDRRVLDSKWIRIHQEDLCQALGCSPSRKYEDDGGPGIIEIANLLNQLPYPERTRSQLRFFDSLVFNFGVANTDAHAKNYSILHLGSRATLAPLYDIGSALPYTRPWGKRFQNVRKLKSAMRYGKNQAFTRITEKDWDLIAAALYIEPDNAKHRRQQLISRIPVVVQDSYTQLADQLNLPEATRTPWRDILLAYHASLQI
jgi:serine/threonine-protein kinase HipA